MFYFPIECFIICGTSGSSASLVKLAIQLLRTSKKAMAMKAMKKAMRRAMKAKKGGDDDAKPMKRRRAMKAMKGKKK